MSPKPGILILGKLPPPFMGPAIATQILLQSGLNDYYKLIHLDTRINTSLESLGKWSINKISVSVRIYFRMLRICLKQKPELILIPISQTSTGFIKDFVFITIGKLTGRKIVLQLRGSNFVNWQNKSSSVMKAIVKTAMKWAEGIIVLGNNLRFLFQDYFPAEKIFVIPNGGNFKIPKGTEKNEETVRLLFLANLFDAKGIRDVIDAIHILNKQMKDRFTLDVVGKWLEVETQNYCMKQIADHKLPVQIHEATSGVEKMNYYASSDIFIFTPRDPEGHPWVIVEAMAAGLPIIATDKGAIKESVINGSNGFIVADRNPKEIADRLELLIADTQLRKTMAAQSLNYYREKFTEEKMVDNYVRCFNQLIQA